MKDIELLNTTNGIKDVVKIGTNCYRLVSTVDLNRTRYKTCEGQMLDSMVAATSSFCGRSYETMVFKCNKDGKVRNWADIYYNRYSAPEEAIKGHEKVVEDLKNGK